MGGAQLLLSHFRVFLELSGSRIQDTLRPAVLLPVERLSSSRRLKIKGKGPRSVSFVGRLSLFKRVLYPYVILYRPSKRTW